MPSVIDDYDYLNTRVKELGHDYLFRKPEEPKKEVDKAYGVCDYCQKNKMVCDGTCCAYGD